jgi:hypothetical protein
LKPAILALLTLLLVACAAERRPAPSVQTDEAARADSSAETADREAAAPAGPAPIPPRPAPKPGPPTPGAQDLIGLTTRQALDLLAAPDSTVQEPPATVWTYERAGCRLELFFYFDLESQEQRTLASDLETGREAAGAEAFCLRILAAHGARGAAAPAGSTALPGAAVQTTTE